MTPVRPRAAGSVGASSAHEGLSAALFSKQFHAGKEASELGRVPLDFIHDDGIARTVGKDQFLLTRLECRLQILRPQTANCSVAVKASVGQFRQGQDNVDGFLFAAPKQQGRSFGRSARIPIHVQCNSPSLKYFRRVILRPWGDAGRPVSKPVVQNSISDQRFWPRWSSISKKILSKEKCRRAGKPIKSAGACKFYENEHCFVKTLIASVYHVSNWKYSWFPIKWYYGVVNSENQPESIASGCASRLEWMTPTWLPQSGTAEALA
ncbi:hypothetical protein HDIA_1967 [Hartmannibacter diazotrophicus]|uniref:Uncharacterized protein n=1 Tax=Hartmannibacter diazotrophicus TaxID=1482074 RepID=A0A2C9D5U0_9HYPH|nr:hypothetical protein [Hartmannibacter diazotrophicus]SON55508.1 hypothetical protein HDIA_1967 [Hartmannibacter diazotrophicus]